MMKHALVFLFVVACNRAPTAAADASSDPPATCTKSGVPCTLSPGKLGVCIDVEQTSSAPGFVCVAQH